MSKKLLVSSAVQAALMTKVIIPEIQTGFWKDHRPSNHGSQWADVEVVVSSTDVVGPEGFKIPRLYNLVNPTFLAPNEAKLLEVAKEVKPASTIRSIKKELIELSRIVGGRLTDKNAEPTKANRGNNKNGAPKPAPDAAPVKKTVTKQKTSAGATVTRVPVNRDVLSIPVEPTEA